MPEPTFISELISELDDTLPFDVAFIPAHHTMKPEICLPRNPTPQLQHLTKREKRTLGAMDKKTVLRLIRSVYCGSTTNCIARGLIKELLPCISTRTSLPREMRRSFLRM